MFQETCPRITGILSGCFKNAVRIMQESSITAEDFCYITRCTGPEFYKNIEKIVDELSNSLKYIKYEDGVLYLNYDNSFSLKHKKAVTLVIS